MLVVRRISTAFIIYTLLLSSFTVQSDMSDRIEFSGFGRIVGGYLDQDSAKYEGYSNNLDFSEQSLFALQSDFRVNDKVSISGQLLAHSSDARESGLEWLYLSYEPSKNWRFKLGKLRTPFFRYSDVIDVGFAYPWVSPPQQIYSGSLFSNYEGVSGTYRFNIDRVNMELEAYYGRFSGEFSRADEQVPLDVDEIKGLIFSFNNGNFSGRVSGIHSSDFYADFPGFSAFADAVEFAGFTENAEALRFNGAAKSYQVNLNYDTLDYFVAAEWIKTLSDLLVVPQIDAYYFTLGYNFYPFQLHATYAFSDSSYNTVENAIPKGVAPQLDQLSFVYDQLTDALPTYPLKSLSLGFRWDFRYDMSLKTEVTFLEGKPNENSFFSDITDPNFDRKGTLYQVAVEWIF